MRGRIYVKIGSHKMVNLLIKESRKTFIIKGRIPEMTTTTLQTRM